VNAVILQKLTYGLSYAYTTKLDEWRLEKVMADAARSIFGVDKKEAINNKWIIRDTGMTNPLDIIKINDIKLMLAAQRGSINTAVRDIILHNAPMLVQKINSTCEAWGVHMEDLMQMQESKLNKYLISKAIARPLKLLHSHLQLKSEEELGVNQPMPTYLTAGVDSDMLATYLESRAGMHWGNAGEDIACPYCRDKPQHTYMHCINECQFTGCATVRDEHRAIYESQGAQLPQASIDTLSEALTSDYHQDLHYFLSMISSSPFL
jgi:hypothetical protein